MPRQKRSLAARSALSRWEERFGPNMTPMIDVVLCILIFFMAGSTFLGKEWFLTAEILRRGKPTARPDPLQVAPTRLTFQLRRQNGAPIITGMGDTPLPLDAFARRIRAFTEGTDTAQIIAIIEPAAPDVTYDDVVRVHEACTAAGITRVGLAESR